MGQGLSASPYQGGGAHQHMACSLLTRKLHPKDHATNENYLADVSILDEEANLKALPAKESIQQSSHTPRAGSSQLPSPS